MDARRKEDPTTDARLIERADKKTSPDRARELIDEIGEVAYDKRLNKLEFYLGWK